MADFGALSSLGVGSGVLTYDVIDKLRAADEEVMIKPIDQRIENLNSQEEELNTIITKTADLKSTVLDLSDSVFLAKRSVDVTGTGVDVSVVDGVATQEIDLTVNQLAKASIDQSKGFASTTSSVSDTDTSMTISIDGNDYTIDVAAGTTLEELAQMINDQTGGKVSASILNTGGTDPYSLIVKSTDTGASQSISYTYTGTDFLGMTNVQAAQDAEFVYNGVIVTRASNTVDDLVTGMTLTLKESGTTNHISVIQDNEAIVESVQAFVDAYNELISELNTATQYDADTGVAGIFQGEGTINSLKYGVSNIVTGTTGAGGLPELGISVDRNGYMTLDTLELTRALEENSQKVSDIFAGSEESPGIFSQLNDFLRGQTIGSDATMTRFGELLEDRNSNLNESRERKLAYLDSKYQIMAKQFAAYDAMIQQMNASYSSLQMVIDSMNNTKQ
ncbi:flagellar filament capping protein FliD [Hydrogenimonas sp.]